MRTTAFALLFAATVALAGDAGWKKQSGRFAVFETPASMALDTKSIGIDSIMETYVSRDISLTFDSEARTLSSALQADIKKAVSVWATEYKMNPKFDTFVENDQKFPVASISHDVDDSVLNGRPHYLFFGLSVGEQSFALHIRFRSLDQLDDIERILKSIKLKAK